MSEYIKIFFVQMVNGVIIYFYFIFSMKFSNLNVLKFFKMNQRFQNSLKNNQNMMITISLTNVLIFNVNKKH